jgi:hypothetical protein
MPIENNTTPNVEITKILIKNINDHLENLNPNLGQMVITNLVE